MKKREKSEEEKMIDDIHEDVSRLVRPYSHNERGHVTTQPSLFNQLRAELVYSTPSDGQAGPTSATESKPPTSSLLLDLAVEIVYVPATLASRLAKKTRTTPEANLTLAESTLRTVQDVQRAWMAAEVSALRDRLEQALSWQHTAQTTNARCPQCKRRGLLVMMDDFGPVSATCPTCKTKWDRAGLGILALQLMDNDKEESGS